jgi:hypothetical protein
MNERSLSGRPTLARPYTGHSVVLGRLSIMAVNILPARPNRRHDDRTVSVEHGVVGALRQDRRHRRAGDADQPKMCRLGRQQVIFVCRKDGVRSVTGASELRRPVGGRSGCQDRERQIALVAVGSVCNDAAMTASHSIELIRAPQLTDRAPYAYAAVASDAR